MTEPYSEQVFRRFVSDLNSTKPAPGGGSAAAFAGAMAGALAGMTAHMTVGKKKYATVEQDMRDVITQSEELQQEMLLMSQEDADIFGLVLDAYKMPRGTQAEKDAREAELQRTGKMSVLASLQLSEACIDILRLAETVVSKGNRMLVTDGAASAILARACLRIAAYNVQANLHTVRDSDFVFQAETRLRACRDLGDALEKDILAEVERKLAK
ncbi:MAG: FTCD-C domain-containing protein [Succiniclasticum sp.]|jgi:methenyltetrahydrofolate cyclohydrolase